MKKEDRFKDKTINLLDGEQQNYVLDKSPKAQIAITRQKDLKIIVNSKFEGLDNNTKLAIIYHELGHSRFKLWRLYFSIARFFSFSFVVILFSIWLLIVRFNFIFLSILIMAIIFFLLSMLIYWFLEILADLNSTARLDKKYLINILKREYSNNKKISLWKKYILHPPWRLRKKIIEMFN